MNATNPVRIEFIDGLKVLMILCVLINHLPQYVGVDVADTIWSAIGGAGVSGFILLSGFGLTYGLLEKGVTTIDVIPFLWKRFLRVVPLYYVALFAYILVVELVSLENLLSHLLLVHTFFEDFSREPGSLWFVGLIVQCYIVFPFAYKLLLHQQGTRQLLLAAALLYGLGLLASGEIYASDLFLNFALEFATGMVLALKLHKGRSLQYSPKPIIAVAILELIVVVALMKFAELESLSDQSPITTLTRLCFFVIAFNGLLFVERTWTGFKRIVPLLLTMSAASYAVYLFHRPMLTIITEGPIWQWVIDGVESTAVRCIILFVFGVPIFFLVGHWIQIAYDSSLKSVLAQIAPKREEKLT